MRGFKQSSNNKRYPSKEKYLVQYNKAIDLQNKGHLDQAARIYHNLIKKKYFAENVFINYASICQHQNK